MRSLNLVCVLFRRAGGRGEVRRCLLCLSKRRDREVGMELCSVGERDSHDAGRRGDNSVRAGEVIQRLRPRGAARLSIVVRHLRATTVSREVHEADLCGRGTERLGSMENLCCKQSVVAEKLTMESAGQEEAGGRAFEPPALPRLARGHSTGSESHHDAFSVCYCTGTRGTSHSFNLPSELSQTTVFKD